MSVEPAAPQGTQAGPLPDALWLVLDVTNTTDGIVTLSSRPRPPAVLDARGNQLEVRHTGVTLRDGGGSFGAASSALGEPYLRPGGAMRLTVAVADASVEAAGRPLTIRYAPFLRHGAEFSVE